MSLVTPSDNSGKANPPGRHAVQPSRYRRKAIPFVAAATTLGAAIGVTAALTGGSAGHVQPAEMTTLRTAAADKAGNAAEAGRAATADETGSQANSTDMIMTREMLSKRASHVVAATPQAAHARPRHAQAPSTHTVSCSTSASGMLPDNYPAIVTFLIAHGYSHNAAAGIAGNIYQESKGNPESVGSGGGGLIGWTPLRYGLITGNPTADLQAQLQAILVYNLQWSAYLPALNSASSPAAAADIYVTDFERAGIPAASHREAAASAVAAACHL